MNLHRDKKSFVRTGEKIEVSDHWQNGNVLVSGIGN